MGTPKAFNYSAFDTLTVCETIVEQCIIDKTEIVKKRPGWADSYFPDLLTKIQDAYNKHLHIDNAKELKDATKALNSIKEPAKNDLSSFNVQLKNDFKDNKTRLNEIKNTLGFTAYYSKASTGVQSAILNLLYQFKNNMTDELAAEINAKGIDPLLIPNLKGYADTLKAANVTQESAKKNRPKISDASIVALNEIYNTVISICEICRNIFKKDPVKSDMYSFTKTVEALGNNNGGNNEGGDQTPPTPPPAQ